MKILFFDGNLVFASLAPGLHQHVAHEALAVRAAPAGGPWTQDRDANGSGTRFV